MTKPNKLQALKSTVTATASRVVKALDDPKTAKKIHGRAGIIWLLLSLPICIFLNSSIPLLVFISVYAIVVGHWSGWDAAGGEVEIEKLHKRMSELEKRK